MPVDDSTLFDPNAARQPDKTRYPGKEVHVSYERSRCMHAAECGRASKAVFNAKRDPWIEPDEMAAADLVRVVERCPTGALRALRPDGSPIEETPPPSNEISICADGPIYVRGRVRVEIDGEAGPEETRIALCRCGASKNKPYCDGTHTSIRFHDAGGVNSDAGDPPEGGAPLTITLAKNGPLLVNGPLTIRAASGRRAKCGDSAALCRCGHSANKPFCDGTHKRVGWKAVDGDGR